MLKALITLEITGADISCTLRAMNHAEITLLATVPKDELTVQVTVLRTDYGKCRRIIQKRGDKMTVKNRRGLYWTFRRLLDRPVLVLGILGILTAALYLPSRVLFVRVEGNRRVPARRILAEAENCGICFGASRRAVRSARMKNNLLEAVPQLQWAGVNTRGCVAVITVRERAEQGTGEPPANFGHIVALTDGIITDCTATRGSLLCTPGQAVRQGQILISGYTDTGLTIRAEPASGEVFGQTRRRITAVTPDKTDHKSKRKGEEKKISLLLGKKRIILWNSSRIWDSTCDRMYEEYYITLPGGFVLPLALSVERYVFADTTPREFVREKAEGLLGDFARGYLKNIMIAGTLERAETALNSGPGIWILAGEYRCTELIGVQQRFQIGEENE